MRPSWRSALLWVGIAVTLVSTSFALRGANLEQVWDAFVESEKVWLLPALAFVAIAVWMRAVRWRAIFALNLPSHVAAWAKKVITVVDTGGGCTDKGC